MIFTDDIVLVVESLEELNKRLESWREALEYNDPQEGKWVDDPKALKDEFLSHFQERFDTPITNRLRLDLEFSKQISVEQLQDLERNVSIEEIKRAVWDCGLDKSPGPDGFTFVGSFPKGGKSGPFILDELIHWCRSKKKQALIFKVDFEKAYDSVRWDFLDDVLNKFGFGSKWRMWISNCLMPSKGSNLENARMFKGISVSSSLQLSHLFYADDVIFMGQSSESNINMIIQALDCFHQASALRMNLQKSKLMGIFVKDDIVSRAAIKMRCSTLKALFIYLGVKVRGSMARVRSWDEIVEKIKKRISKWKINTLSIGGRLTLIKSVLSLTPLYYMSMFKVPSQVLKFLEGIELKENKMSWFKWDKVLMAKDKGGLGISIFLR
nr:RNA-directed DNA polymerase, eukaryota [Tanacetum cinerariifolium]